ncbi:hypothetical protein DM02DRAFT_721115 [Periconia macrospinosa]|uniref:NAD(P)-binding protein n=1 Tax=Periconia macrospinosa TaxID=97972 RepID=A0A2V1D9F2_9PLEO|nr:hypothetical protein DM02DRAFT_721115 [Periconia macrospinosa]
MPSPKQIQTSLSTLSSGPSLVVALIGATSGVGSYTARALARTYATQGSKLRVYLVGRNATRGAELLEYAHSTSPGSEWRFLEVKDLSLMSEVDGVVRRIEEVERKEPFQGQARLDALWISPALSPLQETWDKIKTVDAAIGTPAPGTYGVTAVRTNVVFMKTFMFEELAKQHAGKISFTHNFPGLVDGHAFYSDVNPWWALLMWRILKPLLWWYLTPPDNERGGGAYAVGQRGDAKGKVAYANIRKDDTARRVWEHTMNVLEGIDKKNAAA